MFDRLSDEELRPIMRAADALPTWHRELFLQRVAAHLHLRGRSAVDEAVQRGLAAVEGRITRLIAP